MARESTQMEFNVGANHVQAEIIQFVFFYIYARLIFVHCQQHSLENKSLMEWLSPLKRSLHSLLLMHTCIIACSIN